MAKIVPPPGEPLVRDVPGKDDPRINEERTDRIPERGPILPWPKPVQPASPMRIKK